MSYDAGKHNILSRFTVGGGDTATYICTSAPTGVMFQSAHSIVEYISSLVFMGSAG